VKDIVGDVSSIERVLDVDMETHVVDEVDIPPFVPVHCVIDESDMAWVED
jgi:hypothetical protein